MKSSSLKRVFTLGCLVCLALPIACGDDDDDSPGSAGKGGSAGTAGKGSGGGGKGGTAGSGGRAPTDGGAGMELPPGLSTEPSTEECGAETCESAQAGGIYYVDPCCGAGDACGLNTAFLSLVGAQFTETCQVHDQPGTDEGSCAAATGLSVPFQGIMLPLDPFPGCCRPDGTCGVVVDDVTSGAGALPLASLGLGCVEAAPFFNGVEKRCDDAGGAGGGGAGGSTNSGEGGNGGPAPGGAGGATP